MIESSHQPNKKQIKLFKVQTVLFSHFTHLQKVLHFIQAEPRPDQLQQPQIIQRVKYISPMNAQVNGVGVNEKKIQQWTLFYCAVLYVGPNEVIYLHIMS